jgi:hypothetical protein
MKESFNYSNTFVLDKSHFNECYEQSVPSVPTTKLYFKAIVLTLVGMTLVMASELNPYAAWFIFSLGILEALSSYYRQPWWVMRQMLSKAAKGKVSLTIDSESIHIKSFYVDNNMYFIDISAINSTDCGWLITHKSGRHYLSNRCLSTQARDFLQSKVMVEN